MYNNDIFNQLRFNIVSNDEDIFSVADIMAEAFNAGSALKINDFYSDLFSELFNVSVHCGFAYVIAAELDTQTASDIHMESRYYLDISMDNSFETYSHMSQDTYLSVDFDSAMESAGFLSNNSYQTYLYAEELLEATRMDIRIYMAELSYSEIISCTISVAQYYTYESIIDISIPPGASLVMDSDNYTVYLISEDDNGNEVIDNVINMHSGDWVELNRNSYDVKIDTGTINNLETEILYTERYL